MLSTILTSLVTSLIVSWLTFTVGLRTGKNQADRPKLKESYRKLAVYFASLQKGIAEGAPGTWDFYDHNPNMAITVVYQMQQDGSIIDLPESITTRAQNVEKDALNFAWDYREALKKEKSAIVDFAKRHYSKPPSIIGRHYIEIYEGRLLIADEVAELVTRFTQNPSLGIIYNTEANNTITCTYLYSDLGDMPLIDFINEIHNSLIEKPHIAALLIARQKLLPELGELIEVLKRRTEDPHPFWETVRTAFRDVFR